LKKKNKKKDEDEFTQDVCKILLATVAKPGDPGTEATFID
jgi:hypothetical protein